MRLRRSTPSDVLVVCTGNVCRSPYIARRLQAELPGLTVTAAGTSALRGQQPTEEVSRLLADRGLPGPFPPARDLTRPAARGARLILTAARGHRVVVERLVPGSRGRCFTVLELSRYLVGAGSPRGLGVDGVTRLADTASMTDPGIDHNDDLQDPYGGSPDDYARMVQTVEATLQVITPALETTPDR